MRDLQASAIFSTRARFDDLLLDNIRSSTHGEFSIRLKGDRSRRRRRRALSRKFSGLRGACEKPVVKLFSEEKREP